MQGKAKRECFDIDIEVPVRPGDDRLPFLDRMPRDHELEAVHSVLPTLQIFPVPESCVGHPIIYHCQAAKYCGEAVMYRITFLLCLCL